MHVIYVDDEIPALDNFRLTVKEFEDIENLQLFHKGEDALHWAETERVDIAFLDMEMQGCHGLQLAKKLKEIDENIRIIFVTAYTGYALEAFGVDAIGYVLKPYNSGDIQKELKKALLVRSRPKERVEIQTIPNFVVFVNGKSLAFGRTKTEELLALLVDRGDAGLTVGEAIACLWSDRSNDENAQALYRVTFKRLMDTLKKWDIDCIIRSEGRKKYIVKELIDCDLYRILEGDKKVIEKYAGRYMSEYSWAEERNAQLHSIKYKK